MKTLFYGISIVTLAGLAIGGALRPAGDPSQPGGPRQDLGTGGQQVSAGYEMVTNSYPYGVPDYVTGTDFLQPASYSEAPAEAYASYAAPPYSPTPYNYDLPVIEPASYDRQVAPEPQRMAYRFPSEGGGVVEGALYEPRSVPPAYADSPELIEPADAPTGTYSDAMAVESNSRQPTDYATDTPDFAPPV